MNDIAAIYGCSRRTIERRLNQFHIARNDYSSMTDAQLDQMVRTISSLHPQCGEKKHHWTLEEPRILVQRERIRESIRRVDPIEWNWELDVSSIEECTALNALWHLDGYHKLIRWKIVIHGGIDGHCRLITYLRSSSNNRASTVLSAFTSAVDEFGLPSRIRTDRGGENVLVSEYVLQHPQRGPDRGSVIVGRSVHNQRIERLWRDLYSGCACLFFYFLEDAGMLNCDSALDLYALDFVFLPVIQKQLSSISRRLGSSSPYIEQNEIGPRSSYGSCMGIHQMISQNQDQAAVTGVFEVIATCSCIIVIFSYDSRGLEILKGGGGGGGIEVVMTSKMM